MPRALSTFAVPSSDRTIRVGLLAGLVASAVEMVPILLVQVGMLHFPVLRVFQAIASGLLGRAAYAGGIGTALLGAALHVLISLGAGLAFAFAARRQPVLLRRPVLAGLGYGAVVYVVMSYIVVPLSAAAFPPATKPAMIAMSLLVHMITFGLPIALVCRRLARVA